MFQIASVMARRGNIAHWAVEHRIPPVFATNVVECPHCGGRLRLITTLHDPVVIRKLLAHLGMARSGPSPGPKWVTIIEAHPHHRDVFDQRPWGHALVDRAHDARCPRCREEGAKAAQRTR